MSGWDTQWQSAARAHAHYLLCVRCGGAVPITDEERVAYARSTRGDRAVPRCCGKKVCVLPVGLGGEVGGVRPRG